MGCDIHVYSERKTPAGWEFIADLDWDQDYALFGWLAGVRYSAVKPLCEPRGLPDDLSERLRQEYDDVWQWDAHSASWFSVDELLAVDYSQLVEERHGGCTCDPGDGKTMTLLEFLGEDFVKSLHGIKASGADRIVFWFDN